MARPKLIKEGGKVSRKFPVKDVNGNAHILKATIVSVRKGVSAAIVDDDFSDSVFRELIIRPPLNQHELAVLSEFSSELEQVIDSMEIGIHGFGGRLMPRGTEDQRRKHKKDIEEEKQFLDSMIHYPNPTQTWKKLMKTTRGDLEKTGNAWWELVPSEAKKGRYSSIIKMDPTLMFFTRVDKKLVRKKLKYVNDDLRVKSKSFHVRFRKILSIARNKKVWFKEFGDPRIIDRRTGEIIAQSEEGFETKTDEVKKRFPRKIWANEVYHHKLDTTRRTPYGMPRYTGNIIAVKGSRSADETNIITQQNNHVPSMVISVAGGQLTGGSVERIQEFVDTQIKGDSNYSKFLIIEGESTHDSLSGAGSLKVDVKPLTEAQHNDELWQSYDKNNASKIRRSFRLAPIMVGAIEDLNRSAVQESERLAEKWVYNPEREDFDDCINQIFMQQELRFWWWKTNSPNVTNDEDLVDILANGEKTGGLTPRIARQLLEDILNRELPPIPDKTDEFDPDIPFSLSLAKMTTRAANANVAGTFSPQGQIPAPKRKPGRPNSSGPDTKVENVSLDLVDQLFNQIDPHNLLNILITDPKNTINTLSYVADRIEDTLDRDSFGDQRGDYFDAAT